MTRRLMKPSEWLRLGALVFLLGVGTGSARADERQALFAIPSVAENPFEISVLSRTEKEGAVLEELMINGAPFNGEPTRIYAWLAYPKDEKRHPGVLRLHGAGLKWALPPEAAVEYAQSGYVCLCIDWAGAEEWGVPRPAPRSEFTAFGRMAQPHRREDGVASDDRWDLAAPATDAITNGVRFVRRSLQFLRSRPDVDPARLCISAMSAGAHVTLLALPFEPEVRAAALKYGSGFVRELNWGGYFGRLGKADPAAAANWLAILDAKHGLADIRTPTLLLSGTDDAFFFMPAVLATWRALPEPKALLMLPNDNHTQVSNETIPRQWFDSVLGGRPEWPRAGEISAQSETGALLLSVRAEGAASEVVFFHKRMPREKFRFGRGATTQETVPWSAASAQRSGARWVASLAPVEPGEQVVAYGMITAPDGVRVSTDTVEIPALPSWRKTSP